MLRGLFVTGTDTGVGKTVVSATVMRRYQGALALRYWKPIQTGIEQDDDTAEVARLSGCEVLARGVRLPRPLSPHLAARLHGERIDVDWLAGLIGSGDDRSWVVEGAGGVLVPIDETNTMADWMRMLGLPILVVARSGLGTINHTLLTLDALRSRDLRIAGVAMVGEPDAENRVAIERYGGVRVVSEMPRFDSLGGEWARWADGEFDMDGKLLEFLK